MIMIKFICVSLMFISYSVNAMQSKQEIIDYCTKTMLSMGGNVLVMQCIKMELDAQKKIQEVSRDDAQ